MLAVQMNTYSDTVESVDVEDFPGPRASGLDAATHGAVEDLFGARSGSGADGDRLRRLAAVGLMTPSVVHDLNNMLQSVGSVLQMIDVRIAHGSPEEVAKLAADGLRAIDRAAMLSKRLTAFGRPRPPMRSRVGVNGLLRDFQPLLRWTLGFGITLELSLADGPLETWCDPQDLENAVMNLAVNARDAMPDGGLLALQTFNAELHLDRPGLPSGDYVMITATDTGHGMAPKVIASAFDPFFTTKAETGGSGLGLASVKAFVDAAGGGADIVSRPGAGTTVRLYLPKAERPGDGVPRRNPPPRSEIR
jgi:signal transduction histidine kinase